MRLFVAVLPPPVAVAELAEVVTPLMRLPGADGLRWTERDGWHLTLAFLGHVPDQLLPELARRLERAARRHPAPTLRLAGGGRFGDNALWAGAGGQRAELGRLARSAAAAGRRTGIPVDDRPFRAHLTLARGRSRRGSSAAGTDLGPYARALEGFQGTPWTVDALRLMSSTPGGTGRPPRYATEAGWPLAAAQE